MGIIENITSHLKRSGPEKPKPSRTPTSSRIWNYGYFREYLMALARDSKSLLPVNRYPDIIHLSEGWHSELDKMRADTLDGRERYTTIAYEGNRQRILIAQKHLVGTATHVSGETVQLARRKVFDCGLDGIIGDIHSHPRGGTEAVLGHFSAGDYYTQVTAGSPLLMMALVDGDENIFAFRTTRTKSTEVDANLLNQDTFCRTWYEIHGFRYLGMHHNLVPISDTASAWNVNRGIANRHGLVVYGGGIGEELVRLTPAI